MKLSLPGGPVGKTCWPLRDLRLPPDVSFLDSRYHAGYPDAHGVVTQSKLKGYWHTGLDLNGTGGCNTDQGDPVFAVRDGVIEYAGIGGGTWGNIVVLRVTVDGRVWWARYGHVQWTGKNKGYAKPAKGQTIRAGDVLAFVGRGAWPCAHLHFDVFHTRPPTWGWWPLRGAQASSVTAYLTDPYAWLRRLGAVKP